MAETLQQLVEALRQTAEDARRGKGDYLAVLDNVADVLDKIAANDQRAEPYITEAKRRQLFCLDCGGQFSATRGDYFLRNPADVLLCGECDAPLYLRQRITISGHDKQGRAYVASGWLTLSESVTPDDLFDTGD